MSKSKQNKASHNNRAGTRSNKTPGVAPVSVPSRKKRSLATAFVKTRVFAVEFVFLWLFLYILYGDVLYVAEQRSFFAFDSVAMQYYLSQPLGWLYAVGRFMLLSGACPILASLLLAVMLTVATWLFDRAFRLKGWWHMATAVLPFLYVFFLFYKGLNLVYLRELSLIMTIPFVAMLCAAVMALLSKIVFKTSISLRTIVKPFEADCKRSTLWVVGVMAALMVTSVAVALTYAQNDRITCTMERYMYNEDWDKMADAAKQASRPSRTVMGLYAVALNQNGQMATELFNIPMQYGNIHLTRSNGNFDSGIDFLVIYANFYAGLTRSAYHEAVEQTVTEGPSIVKLKYMVKCALIDKEYALAEKYLAILKKVPFESDFVEKYSDMLYNYDKISQDNELASVIELQPLKDSFEQEYRKPMFLGYNVRLMEAKSIRGLNNCLYACLYSKDLNGFWERIITMIQNNVMLSKVFEEAIVVKNLKNLSVLKQIQLSTYTLQEFKNFMGDCFPKGEKSTKQMGKEEKTEWMKQKAHKFKDKYLGTYEYYYYFQNVPDENYEVADADKKGGVN